MAVSGQPAVGTAASFTLTVTARENQYGGLSQKTTGPSQAFSKTVRRNLTRTVK